MGSSAERDKQKPLRFYLMISLQFEALELIKAALDSCGVEKIVIL